MKKSILLLFSLLLASTTSLVLLEGCQNQDQCSDIICQNNGECIDGTCVCPSGWIGEFCEIQDPNTADRYDCTNGNCNVAPGGQYSSLAACQVNCQSQTEYYVCFEGDCIETNQQQGQYTSLASCEANCGGCQPDFSVTAPYVAGNLPNSCLGGNKCPEMPSADHIYEVVIETSDEWTFSLCNSVITETFDTYLKLGTECCSDDLASDNDGCGVENLSEIVINLNPGTYYLTVEGYTGDCENYAISIKNW